MLERSQPCEGQRRQRWLLIGAAEPANDDEMGGHEVMLLCLAEELSRQGVVEPKLLARPATSLRKRGEQFAPRLDLTPVLILGKV